MSHSVKELQTRIKNISIDIKRQKEVLKQLVADKSLAQCQLNAILDPVARLPLDISSGIFLQCLPPLSQPRSTNIPLLLLNICHSWSQIALSTPALWAAIRIDFPRP
ncbi:hypothetical protein DFH07DRAFT_742044, partial [Mycena maculata]